MTAPPPRDTGRRPAPATLAALAALAVCALALTARAERLDLERVRALREAGEIHVLGDILRDARRRYRAGRLVEAELEKEGGRLVYEVKFLDGDGRLHELYYDARSGRLFAIERHERDASGRLRDVLYDPVTGRRMGYDDDADEDEDDEDKDRPGPHGDERAPATRRP